MEELTRKSNQALKELKIKYTNLMNADISEYKKEIDVRVSRAYSTELHTLLEENDGDVDALIGIGVDELVIPREDIFCDILDEEVAKINIELNDIIAQVRNSRKIHAISVDVKNFKLVFIYEDYRSYDYDKTARRYLKRNNRTHTSMYTTVSEAVYIKQKEIITKLLSVTMSSDTIAQLKKYSFIDHNLKEIIRKLNSALTTGYDDCPLFLGEEINRSLAWLKA